MKTMFRLFFLAAAASLGACTANSYCEGVQPYQKAPSVAPLKSAGDVQFPESASALRIPAPPAHAVPYGEKVKDAEGDDVMRCLDKPPEMPPPAPPANPPAPAASSAPANPTAPAPAAAPVPAESPPAGAPAPAK